MQVITLFDDESFLLLCKNDPSITEEILKDAKTFMEESEMRYERMVLEKNMHKHSDNKGAFVTSKSVSQHPTQSKKTVFTNNKRGVFASHSNDSLPTQLDKHKTPLIPIRTTLSSPIIHAERTVAQTNNFYTMSKHKKEHKSQEIIPRQQPNFFEDKSQQRKYQPQYGSVKLLSRDFPILE